MVMLGMQLAAEQVVTERHVGRMGFWDAVKRVGQAEGDSRRETENSQSKV